MQKPEKQEPPKPKIGDYVKFKDQNYILINGKYAYKPEIHEGIISDTIFDDCYEVCSLTEDGKIIQKWISTKETKLEVQ